MSIVAVESKLVAVASVQPETGKVQPPSVFAIGRKLSAVESVQPETL